MASENILSRLGITFGKIPEIINDNMKYLSYYEEKGTFICIPCDKIIKIDHNREDFTTKNFKMHLLSNAHKYNAITSDELWGNLKLTFPERIPQIVQNNFFVLSMNGKDYECVICGKIITVSIDISVTENNFSYHLLSYTHKEKLYEYRKSKSVLYDLYGGVPGWVMNHAQFLCTNGRHYFCQICEKHIMVHPSDLDETENNFEKHLHSLKHMRNAKQAKAFTLLPELKEIFCELPHYMLRNIEYISVNGPNFFCSLCNDNIKFNRHDLYETEQNFKCHNLSKMHEENLSYRRNTGSEVFNHIQSVFEDLPESVLENLKYLSFNEDGFFCRICKISIYQDEDNDKTKENLIYHFENISHDETVENEITRCLDVVKELEDVFGSVPQLIKDNIQHINFKGGVDFKCTLCNKTMKSKINGEDYESNTSITENNFFSHLNSHTHIKELEALEKVDTDIYNDLEELFSPIPQFIINNQHHLGYEDDSDDFHCFLCNKTIAVVNGNKKMELTEQNFRSHLLSAGHIARLKHNANLIMEAVDKLEYIFNNIPTFVLSNIEHISICGDHFLCTLCDAQIMRGGSISSEKKFREHLFGVYHKSNLKEFEENSDEALQQIDFSFWHIPEFLLRNIDFLCTSDDDDLFCILCQQDLPFDEEDLKTTKQSLRDHMDSKLHQSNLKNL